MPSVNADHAWEAVLNRDRRGDGRFVYAVSSTHVYCRPSCPSRRPARNHVTFFDSAQLADSAGYRACLRCRPQSSAGSEAEERVERARRYLDDHAEEAIMLRYTTVPTVVGRMLIAVAEQGIAAVSLGETEAGLVTLLHHDYPKAVLRRDRKALKKHVSRLLQCLNGSVVVDRLPLDVKATAFQRRVWQALQQIPRGQTRSYQEIARAIGQATAARAVARACAGNPVAVAIPCHRVVRGNGHLAGYRWGLERKQRLLALERT